MEIKAITTTWTQLSTGSCAVKNFGNKKVYIGFSVAAPAFTYEKCFEVDSNEQMAFSVGTGVWAIVQSEATELMIQPY